MPAQAYTEGFYSYDNGPVIVDCFLPLAQFSAESKASFWNRLKWRWTELRHFSEAAEFHRSLEKILPKLRKLDKSSDAHYLEKAAKAMDGVIWILNKHIRDSRIYTGTFLPLWEKLLIDAMNTRAHLANISRQISN